MNVIFLCYGCFISSLYWYNARKHGDIELYKFLFNTHIDLMAGF